MADAESPPEQPERRTAAGRRRMSCLEAVGVVLGVSLALAGLVVVGVMVLLYTGSIRLFPNK